MADQAGKESLQDTSTSIKRRGLLRFGTLVTAFTGASAISALGAKNAEAAPGDKNPPNTYVPIAEKGVASGVATLDIQSKIPIPQVPDLSTAYVPKWRSNTAYVVGDIVLSPAGDVVCAKASFTTTSSYLATNWNVSAAARLGNDPLDFGASADSDSAQSFINAAASKLLRLRPGATYRVTTPVTLPKGTTLEGNGATIQLLAQGQIIATDGCTIQSTRFVNGNTVGFVGGERAITVQGENVTVEHNTFAGQDYRHGVVIERSGGGSCDHCTIRHNRFTNTAYGILKQGGPTSLPCTAHYLKIHDNTFKTVRRGDAIELNAGSDHDILIESNIIDDVAGLSTSYAGFGIAVAGLTGYSAPEEDRFRRCTIANNIITNVEKAGIHAEVSARIQISNNHVEQVSASRLTTGIGIVVYGSINCTIQNNTIYQFQTGILDGIGYLNGENIVSTDRNKIRDNDVSNCIIGICEGVAGEGKTAFIERNTITDCSTGIKQSGAASGVYYTSNILVGCTTSFQIDANPIAKSTVSATNRRINLKGNQSYALDGTDPKNTFSNTSGTTISGDGNNFSLPA